MSENHNPRHRRSVEAPQRVEGRNAALQAAGYVSWLDAVSTWTVGPLFVLISIVLAVRTGWEGWSPFLTAFGLVSIFVLAFRTELSRSYGATVATQPALMALALCTPVGWMPLCTAIGVYAGTMCAGYPRSARISMLRVGLAVNSLGLAAVVSWTGMTWTHWTWPLLGAAYAGQILVDTVTGGVRAGVQGASLRPVATAMAMTYAIDALLGTIGLALIILARGRFPGLLLLVVPVLLIWLLSRDRQAQYEETVELGEAFTAVTEQARIDPLTGLANRRVWEEAVAAATADDGGPVGGRTVTVLLSDLDFLKVANDTYGHDEGDLLIVELARVLEQAGPPGSTVARIGGDEFGILHVGEVGELPPDLVGTTRRLVHEHASTSTTTRVRLSTSLGQASTPACPTIEAAVVAADEAARRDKYERRAGRQDAPAPTILIPAVRAAARSEQR